MVLIGGFGFCTRGTLVVLKSYLPWVPIESILLLGNFSDNGNGVEVDKKKAKHYYELAAMKVSVHARHNIGCSEIEAGNYQRGGFKHLMLAASAGYKESLETLLREDIWMGML